MSANNTVGYELGKVSLRAPLNAIQLEIRLAEAGWDSGEDVRFDNIGVHPPFFGCFIATAAYGTPTAPELDILRAFRDEVLLQNSLGTRLVALYYGISPPLADFISEHELVRTLVRELLVDPAVWVVEGTQALWRD